VTRKTGGPRAVSRRLGDPVLADAYLVNGPVSEPNVRDEKGGDRVRTARHPVPGPIDDRAYVGTPTGCFVPSMT
jgi:hypothetical protein